MKLQKTKRIGTDSDFVSLRILICPNITCFPIKQDKMEAVALTIFQS